VLRKHRQRRKSNIISTEGNKGNEGKKIWGSFLRCLRYLLFKFVHPLFEKADKLSHEAIGAAIEVHRIMGAGLLEEKWTAFRARCSRAQTAKPRGGTLNRRKAWKRRGKNALLPSLPSLPSVQIYASLI
jgi:hypothetical protein